MKNNINLKSLHLCDEPSLRKKLSNFPPTAMPRRRFASWCHSLKILGLIYILLSFGTAEVSAQNAAAGTAASSLTKAKRVDAAESFLCPCRVFRSADASAIALYNDSLYNKFEGLQVGMKFRTSVDGYVTGVRFYKQRGNSGKHIGQLYNPEGELLASVTFTNETTSGWQQASFSAPVAISANKTYIISYYSSKGYYSATTEYFSKALDNPPLRGLGDWEDGPNGVYRYTDTPAFPTSTYYQAANYWVDVVFSETLMSPRDLVVYPNPFSDRAFISFILKEKGSYKTTLYDAKGERIAVMEGYGEAGENYYVEVDGAYLANGLYIIKLQTPSNSTNIKLMHSR